MSRKFDIQRARAIATQRVDAKEGQHVTASEVMGRDIAMKARHVEISKIRRGVFQPRLQLDEAHIAELASSIAQLDISEPVILRRIDNGPEGEFEYDVIGGEHRIEAALRAEMSEVPALIRVVDEVTARILAVTSNSMQQPLKDFEIGRVVVKIREQDPKRSISDLAQAIGVSRQKIYACIALASLPGAICRVLEAQPGLIGADAGEELKKLVEAGNEALVIEAVKRVEAGKLNQTKAADWVREQISPDPKAKATPREAVQGKTVKASLGFTAKGFDLKVEVNAGVDHKAIAERIKAFVATL